MNELQLSERFLNLENNEKEKIIEIGEYIYFNGLKCFYNNKHDKELYATQKRIDDIKESTSKQIEVHTNFVRDQSNAIIDTKDNLIESKQLEINELKTRVKKLEEENCTALSLSSKLDSLMGKGNTVDNIMKGDFGENIVQNQIQHWYQTSEIDDVSSGVAKGDLLWKLNQYNLKCLVEVKNVKAVRPTELQKFERDMVININDGTCNCGLFVSLKTETIPNKGSFKLEFINDCPIIYVSDVLDNLIILRFALDCILNIQNKMSYYNSKVKCDTMNENFEEHVILFIQNTYNKFCKFNSNIIQMKSSIDVLTQCVSNDEKLLKDIMESITELRNKNDIFKQLEFENKNTTKMDLKENILKDMREFFVLHNKVPQISDLTHKYKQSIFRDELAFKKLKDEM